MTWAVERLAALPGQGPSRLYDDFVSGAPALAPFFGASLAAIESGAAPPRRGALLDRAARRELAAALCAQPGAEHGAPAQRDAIAALEEEETLAVVAGQQPGLFLGPLLTLYKAVSAVALAGRLARRLGRAVVPVFWIVAEDDDLSEIADLVLPGGAGGLEKISLFTDRAARERRTYARLRAREETALVASAVAARLGDGEGARRLSARIARAARHDTPVAVFASLLGELLGPLGLVVADPSDPRLKALLAPAFRRELENPLATPRGAADAGRRLVALGYHAQVAPEAGRAALFALDDSGRRQSLEPERLSALAARPERLVPNVLLRPTFQDLLFPTVASVCGPSEVAYLAQVGEVYARHGVPRPAVVPRLSALLVEPHVARFLDRDRPDLALLCAAPTAVPRAGSEPAEVRALERPVADLDAALSALEERLLASSPPLAAMTGGARRKILFETGRLLERLSKELDREGEAFRRRAARARERICPDGRPQERVLSPLPFLARWESLPEMLAAVYDPGDARPLLVRLPDTAEGGGARDDGPGGGAA